MAGRLPECSIAPEHLLDLRASVRLRHTLVNECGERMQAVLYHHALPKHAGLLTREHRASVAHAEIVAVARHRRTVRGKRCNPHPHLGFVRGAPVSREGPTVRCGPNRRCPLGPRPGLRITA